MDDKLLLEQLCENVGWPLVGLHFRNDDSL
jgi:hypothetical protein